MTISGAGERRKAPLLFSVPVVTIDFFLRSERDMISSSRKHESGSEGASGVGLNKDVYFQYFFPSIQ